MEFLLLLALIGLLCSVPYLQDIRENAIARRLERLRNDPNRASDVVDSAISQLKTESEVLSRLRDHHL